MIITEYSKTIYPQTIQGRKMADEIELKLKSQGCFISREEDTVGIVLRSRYIFVVEDEENLGDKE